MTWRHVLVAVLAAALFSGPAAGKETRAQGIDVSHFQHEIDWQAVAASGRFSFAIVKATEGVDSLDERFQANWRGAQRAGLIRGAYHFFEPKDDAMEQVDFFLKTTGDAFEPGTLPPILDVEIGRGVDPKAIVEGVAAWLEAVEKATGRTPILYTGWRFWNSLGTQAFGRYPLWLAEYGTAEADLTLPAGWSEWTLWQRSERGRVSGIEKAVDLNLFAGTEQDLQQFALGSAAERPPR
ncbi:MAG: GH25 family lysozyme [Acidobacteriota bacterium]